MLFRSVTTRPTQGPRGRVYAALQEGPTEASVPAYLANQTIDTLEHYATVDKPFFVSCNFWGPHAPFRITNPHYDMYDPADCDVWPNFQAPLDDKPRIVPRQGQTFDTGWMREDDLRGLIARHYGYVTLIDDQIGRILKKLEELGKLDETLIIYAADHGSALGAFGMWDKGFGMYEHFWRVPMVFSHPSLTPGSNEAFVSLLDLAPTFVDVAGAEQPPRFEGHSLMPLLRGETDGVRPKEMVFEHFGHQFPVWQRMVRTERYKYVYNPSDIDEFYDLDEDPWEMRNLADTVSEDLIEPMRQTLRDHIQRTNDPIRGFARDTL